MFISDKVLELIYSPHFNLIPDKETNMKKKLAIILCTSLSLSLFACGGNSSNSNTTSVGQSSSKPGKETSNNNQNSESNSAGKTDNSTEKTSSSTGSTGANDAKKGSSAGDTDSHSSENDISGVKVTDLMGKICKDTKAPANEIFELDKKNFELYSFIKWTDGIEAACSEGQISTDAHSLVLIRGNGADTKTMAEDIAAKADPRKWICVGAEVGKVLYTDKYVLMVMTYKDAYEGIKSNFEKLVGSDVQIVDMKKSGSLE